MDREILKHLEKIKKLTLFSKIEASELEKILGQAKIINCKKGKTLFSEEEKIEKFYLILEGSIKLSNIDCEGKEAIIKIIDSGSISDIYSDNFSFKAIAAKDSILLVFPLENFRKLIKKNILLLENFLIEISKQNKSLLNQLSNLKLGNGKEKIGQFLLRSIIKEGRKNNHIDLEYSKSEIASYLGIRLETFSRILHQLENDGDITIKKNKIILTQKDSLCKYCNNETTTECKTHNLNFCEK